MGYNLNLNMDESILKKRLRSQCRKIPNMLYRYLPERRGVEVPLKSELNAESSFQRGQDGKGREVTFPWGSQTSPAAAR